MQEGYPDKMSVSESHRGIPTIWLHLRMADNSPEKGQVGGLGKSTWVATLQEEGEQSSYRTAAMV